MPKHKAKLILNPNANLGRAFHAAADLRTMVEEFGGADWSGTVYPGHATELAEQAAEAGYELVIAAGGDGTVHEVVNGLMQAPAESRPRLGVIPLGSGNDFAHAVGMDNRPPFAVRQIFNGQPRRIDLGKMVDGHGQSQYWDNTVGIGFDTIVTIRSRNVPVVRGFLIYLVAVIQTIMLDNDAPRITFRSDLEQWEEQMLMLVMCNGGREGGGFMISPQARPDDGIFHYAGIRRVSRPMMFRLVPEVMKGTHGRFRQTRLGEFHNLELNADRPLYIHADGEIYSGFGMDMRRLSLEILPGAIEVLV